MRALSNLDWVISLEGEAGALPSKRLRVNAKYILHQQSSNYQNQSYD